MADNIPHNQIHTDKLDLHEQQISKLQSDMTRIDTNVSNISSNVDKIINSIASLHEITRPKGTNWSLFVAAIAFIFTISGTVLTYTNGVLNDKLNVANQNVKDLQVEMKAHNEQLHQIQVDALKVQIEQLKSK